MKVLRKISVLVFVISFATAVVCYGQSTPKAKIVASMPDSIRYRSWIRDGWRYNYTVTFTESQGVSANVEWLKRVYTDRYGAKWSSDWGFNTTIVIEAHGKNSYSSWVRGTVKPDLKGGIVTVSFSGHDENGHAFSGSISSKLAWPEE